MTTESKSVIRCAIYTRKSSEEGLEMSFNSLDAQREACQAFIISQRHEGWRALLARYDDGGYSGELWSAPVAVEMKMAFISSLRLLAQLSREPLSKNLRVAAERTFSLRDMINSSFDEVRALADAVLLETGVSRQQDLTLRRRILRWQPRLRMLFITRVALWRYRLQVPGFEMPRRWLEHNNGSINVSLMCWMVWPIGCRGKPRIDTMVSESRLRI
jgi:hypothetical protein